MKKLFAWFIGIALTLSAVSAYARCTTQTINQGGRIVICTVCCDNFGNCNTFCN